MDVMVNLAVAEVEDFSGKIAEARKTGFKATRVFEGLGVASGKIDVKKLPQLRRVHGIHIEEDRDVSAI